MGWGSFSRIIRPVSQVARVALAPVSGGMSLAQNRDQVKKIATIDAVAVGVVAAPGVGTALLHTGGAIATAELAAQVHSRLNKPALTAPAATTETIAPAAAEAPSAAPQSSDGSMLAKLLPFAPLLLLL